MKTILRLKHLQRWLHRYNELTELQKSVKKELVELKEKLGKLAQDKGEHEEKSYKFRGLSEDGTWHAVTVTEAITTKVDADVLWEHSRTMPELKQCISRKPVVDMKKWQALKEAGVVPAKMARSLESSKSETRVRIYEVEGEE